MESGVKRMNETKFQTVLTIAYWASIGGLLYFLVRYLLVWTLPLFFGLAIAALTRPAALTLTKKTRLGRKKCCHHQPLALLSACSRAAWTVFDNPARAALRTSRPAARAVHPEYRPAA